MKTKEEKIAFIKANTEVKEYNKDFLQVVTRKNRVAFYVFIEHETVDSVLQSIFLRNILAKVLWDSRK